jgi:diguanylate cyclase (GGDEF)-like protein
VHADCAVISFRDVSDRMQTAQHLEREATCDALTGLPNRRAFLAQVEKAIAAATRHCHPMSLCLCDLDRFKTINDQHGHGVGDAALCHFAKLLRGALRHEDTAARLGGDEFTALFTYVGASQAAVCLERLRETLASTLLILSDGTKLAVNGSFGLAEWRRGMNAEQLLQAADKALYEAKASGRNRVAVRA